MSESVLSFRQRGSLNRVFDALGRGIHLHLRPLRGASGDEIGTFELYWVRGCEPRADDGSTDLDPEVAPDRFVSAGDIRRPQGRWFGAGVLGVTVLVSAVVMWNADRMAEMLSWLSPHPRTPDGKFEILEDDVVRRVADRALMVRVPAGEFAMGPTAEQAREHVEQLIAEGVPEDHARNAWQGRVRSGPFEGRSYPVYLDGYWIDKYEVTNRQYRRFVLATGHRIPEHSVDPARYTLWDGTDYPAELEDHPVVNVSWFDALEFCEWAGGYLPTEAQWEKAARGTDGRIYPWGNRWQSGLANTGRRAGGDRISDPDGPYARTTPVGYFPTESPSGAKDMAGNVGEWVFDWAAPLARRSRVNPRGPSEGNVHVFRGGTWTYVPGMARTHSRLLGDKVGGYRDTIIGFRCAATLPSLESDETSVAATPDPTSPTPRPTEPSSR